ncbi:MAG TPA: CehA/McbA family metallohydrolase [Planctomycetaceae bacterium]|nr:CehA/McbA family metallohydrolase [Planctomycetaceae bacterium]
MDKVPPHQWMRRVAVAGIWFAAAALAASGARGGTLALSVVDDSGASMPCRIFLKDAADKPVRAPGLPFWRDHFVCSGRVAFDIPAGRYAYEIERGPEFRRLAGAVDVPATGRAAVAVVLTRIADMPSEGWFAGDLHIHRPVAEIPLLLQANDLHFAPVITWWNHRGGWADEHAPGQTAFRVDKDHYYDILAGEDEREGGALLYFGLKRPLPIQHASPEYPSSMKFAELARGEPNAWIDIEKPFWWDVPVWLASGMMDSIELANNHMCRSQMYESEAWGKPRDRTRLPPPKGNGYWSQEIYYHVLNSGLRIPPTAGSASGVLPNPVGYNRVYAQVGPELTPERWWAAVKAGRSFVTNGPLLRVTAGGHLPGHVFTGDKTGRVSVQLAVRLTSNDPVRSIEIVGDGEVVRTIPVTWNARTGEAVVGEIGTLEFDASGWFLLRVIVDNPATFRFAATAPFYVEIGDSPRRISRQSVTFFRDWVDTRIARIQKTVGNRSQRAEILRYHDNAQAFWEKRLSEANVP